MTDQPDRNPMVQAALEELKSTIRRHYPEAQFRIGGSPDDASVVELVTIVDVDEPDQVLDVVMDRQMEMQIRDELPIFVVTERPIERVLAMIEAERSRRALAIRS